MNDHPPIVRAHTHLQAVMATRIQPDRAALEVAYNTLRTTTPLDVMLTNPTLKPILENVARLHMQRRDRLDIKKLQANDLD